MSSGCPVGRRCIGATTTREDRLKLAALIAIMNLPLSLKSDYDQC